MAILHIVTGPRAGDGIVLEGERVVFGRDLACDHILMHPTVSREHFVIERHGGKHLVVDSDSGNGTYVNGEVITWVELRNGDTIQAGPFQMTFDANAAHDRVPHASGVTPDGASESFDGEPAGLDTHLAVTTERLYPREYGEGIGHFNAGRYFDAHEIWEEVWLRSSGDTKLFYQMLIQAAVGLHHYERGNHRGARGMYKNVLEKIPRLPEIFMSLDVADFWRQYASFFGGLIEDGNESPPDAERPKPRIDLLAGEAGE